MYCLSGNSNILLMPFPFFPHNGARTHRIGQSCRHSSIRRFTTVLVGMAKPATSAKPDRPPIDSSGKRSRVDKKIPPDHYFSWCRLRNTCPESLCEDRPSPERNGNDFPVLSCIRFTFCKRQKTAFSLSPDWPAIQKRLTPDSLVHVKADKNENKRSGLSALCVFHQTVSILFSHL